MPTHSTVSTKSHNLDKTQSLLSNFNELENELHNSQKPLPEKVPRPIETKPETKKETEKAEQDYIKKIDTEHPEQSPYVIKGSNQQQDDDQAQTKSKTVQNVEEILSERIDTLYEKLDDDEKKEFKQKGEETALEINEMVIGFKARARKVIDLIKEWLSLIPGINKYFLEQESKIKTQEIMIYARKYRRENKKQKW